MSGEFLDAATLVVTVSGVDHATAGCAPYESLLISVQAEAELHPLN